MITLADLFALFRIYVKITKADYIYLKFYDNLSGGLYHLDDVEMFGLDNIQEGCQKIIEVLAGATG